MRTLNLYAGIGGNRALWQGVEVLAVEIDPAIAEVYARRFPSDRLVVGDAHKYLEDHFDEFDFIWASPPCPSHGQCRHNIGVLAKGYKPIIPDMRLYGEIIFLQTYCRAKWVVENTVPYYEPLIPPRAQLRRHLFWSNFHLPKIDDRPANIRTKSKIGDWDLAPLVEGSDIPNKRQVLRNCVDSDLGLAIFEAALKVKEYPTKEGWLL